MEDLLAAEALNEYGEPEMAKTSVKRKRKAKKQVNSDPEDEDFATSDGSESEDSEIEIVMTNEEVCLYPINSAPFICSISVIDCCFAPFSHSSEEHRTGSKTSTA
jgi:hypothetical protein